MKFQHITVAGGGVLGSQIAFQSAFYNFNVVIYDLNEETLDAAKRRIQKYAQHYLTDLSATSAEIEQAWKNLQFCSDLSAAVAQADLVIEAIPELADLKKEFYQTLGKVAPSHTIFATNTSSFLPSQFAEATGRPTQFLALHFANNIWSNNIAEVMKQPKTDPLVFKEVQAFAKAIGMKTIVLEKEQPGYLLNSLLIPLLQSATQLWVNGVADFHSIDQSWKVGTNAPYGPFEMIDIIGIETVYNIISCDPAPEQQKMAHLLKNNYLEQGKRGVETGAGFYTYTH